MKKLLFSTILLLISFVVKSQHFNVYKKTNEIKVAICYNSQESYDSTVTFLGLDSIRCCEWSNSISWTIGGAHGDSDGLPVIVVRDMNKDQVDPSIYIIGYTSWAVFEANYVYNIRDVYPPYPNNENNYVGMGDTNTVIMTYHHASSSISSIQDSLNTKISGNGTTLQYIRGNGSKATFPTNVSSFTNDAAYLTGVTNTQIIVALGFTPYNNTNPSGFITGINSTMILTALGFTPYNGTANPNGYIANLSTFTTSNLGEGSNLYYTTTRFNSAFSGKTTTDLSEGINFYYTSSRFNSSFAGKSTTDLSEGINLYYTSARFNTAFSAKNTDNLTEGSTNLYSTNTRIRAAVSLTNTSTTGVPRYDNSTGIITIPTDSTINYAPNRSLVSVAAAANGFQISTTRSVDVYYSGTVSCATQIGVIASVEGYISLEICATNSAIASDWKEVGRISNGSTIGIAVGLALTDKNGSQMNFKVPKGYYIRLRTTNVAGTPTYALTTQIEQLTN